MKIPEYIWQKAEQNMAKRERARLIKARRITFSGFPNVLVNVDGSAEAGASWKFPPLKGVS